MNPLLVLGLVAVSAFAAVTEAEADKHFQSQDWQRAAESYQQLVTVDATRASHWFRLGMARQSLCQTDAYRQLTSSYGPPCTKPQFRALDFWVGDFDVQTPQGQITGHNQIVKILNGCVLQENWTSAGGGDGKSFTWFDPDMKKWRQLYLGANGHAHEYIGEARDGALHFLHDRRHPDGSRQMFRMSFTPHDKGKVRQFIEESWDAGKSWSVWFDGMYIRAKKE